MAPSPKIMEAVEKLGYRVTVGDVAAQGGLNVQLAQQGLLALASDVGGHLQVAESGEIAYLFPKNFKDILRNKFWQLQLQELWAKVWRILFYLIKISFGILLILSLAIIIIAIVFVALGINSSKGDNDSGGGSDGDSGGGGGMFFNPLFWFDPDIFFWIFYWDSDNYYERQRRPNAKPQMGFLESIFSFLFGDGNPNYNLEQRKWQVLGSIIKQNHGAIIAEQITPYLDADLGQGYAVEYEEYMLPVLSKFDGLPEVTPEGEFIYHFPQLQTTAIETEAKLKIEPYLWENSWRFSNASSGQIMVAIILGSLNFIGALVLGNLLPELLATAGSFGTFLQIIYPVLLIYGVGFLAIPLIRYFWIQINNGKVETRNLARRERWNYLAQKPPEVRKKLTYARQFAAANLIESDNLVYTTETDMLEQETNRLKLK